MRIRVVVWTFTLGLVLGAAVALTWLTPSGGASANGGYVAPSPAQTFVVFPSDKGRDARPVPRDWQPREFNGKTYYVVPLSGGRSNA